MTDKNQNNQTDPQSQPTQIADTPVVDQTDGVKPTNPTKPTAPTQPDSQTIQGATTTKQIGKYKVEVIRELCISAASCVAIAPGVFDLDEEGIAILLDQDGNDDQTKLLAAQSCPTAAVIVTDTSTGKQVWPLV